MKTIIYYFTGTGNNLAVAKGLQQELGNTDILPIAALLYHKEIPDEYDRVGFCSPSYYSHVPPFVSKCLSGVKYKKYQIVFSVIGCAGNRGLAVEDIREAVEASGKSVKYEFSVMFPGNYILSYNAFPMIYQRPVLRQSDKKITKIASILKAGGSEIKMGKSLLITKKIDEQAKTIINNFGNMGKEYRVSIDCIKCGRCSRVCPVNNISMDESGVKFGDQCQQCMSCIQWCPQRAIDKDRIAEKRDRYHHPFIKVEDIEKNNRRIHNAFFDFNR